jgi:hypothetical protein
MKEDKSKKGFLECFSDFLADSEGLSHEDLCAGLQEQGIDVEQLEKRGMEIVRKGSEERRLSWQKLARERRAMIEKVLDSRRPDKGGINLRERIKKVLNGSYGQGALSYAETYFHKIETVSEKDLETLLEDLENLDLLAGMREEE